MGVALVRSAEEKDNRNLDQPNFGGLELGSQEKTGTYFVCPLRYVECSERDGHAFAQHVNCIVGSSTVQPFPIQSLSSLCLAHSIPNILDAQISEMTPYRPHYKWAENI